MNASSTRAVDSIALFFLFATSSAALIAAILILGYVWTLETIWPVAALGGLSVGCVAMFFIHFPARWVPAPAPTKPVTPDQSRTARSPSRVSPDTRTHVLTFSDEAERA